jgi:hypothetical protein
MFDLGQDGEMIGVDQNVSGILESGQQVQRFVEPELDLLRWIESQLWCRATDVPLPSDVCRSRTASPGCGNGSSLDPVLPNIQVGPVA